MNKLEEEKKMDDIEEEEKFSEMSSIEDGQGEDIGGAN